MATYGSIPESAVGQVCEWVRCARCLSSAHCVLRVAQRPPLFSVFSLPRPCRCFVAWKRPELESARRQRSAAAERSCGAVGNAPTGALPTAKNETPERCTDTASSRFGGQTGAAGAPWIPHA
jgi:hypothetical protein